MLNKLDISYQKCSHIVQLCGFKPKLEKNVKRWWWDNKSKQESSFILFGVLIWLSFMFPGVMEWPSVDHIDTREFYSSLQWPTIQPEIPKSCGSIRRTITSCWQIVQRNGTDKSIIISSSLGILILRMVDTFSFSFGFQKGGFFAECGALDGEMASNSIFLERARNWTGVLVESQPLNYYYLMQRNRKASIVPACLGTQLEPTKVSVLCQM